MDRPIVYPAALPQDTDLLRAARYPVEGLGAALRMLVGTDTIVEGLEVTATSPASLAVKVARGAIYSLAALDATDYSSLDDDARTVMQQGLLRDPATLTITPPGTSGQSRVYLVQATLQVTDTDASVLPYYNAADPTTAFTGPGNSGTPQNTTRAVRAVVSLKAGTAAATGSQVTPTPDAGYIAIAAVTVANGASSITSGNITDSAPRRVPVALPDVWQGREQIITATGSFTFTAVKTGWHRVRGWAAGGGGSGGNGASGGAGGYCRKVVFYTKGDTVTGSVGAGGAGASSAGTAGNGGNTTWGAVFTASGGTGAGPGPGSGGAATGGDLNTSGRRGADLDGTIPYAPGGRPADDLGFGRGGDAYSGVALGEDGTSGGIIVEW